MCDVVWRLEGLVCGLGFGCGQCLNFRIFEQGRRDDLEDSAGKGPLSPRYPPTEEQNPGLSIATTDLTRAASRKSGTSFSTHILPFFRTA